MAYQSRLFQSRWTYEPFNDAADDFNNRVGRVLSRGAYSGELHASGMYASSLNQQDSIPASRKGADSSILSGSAKRNSTPNKQSAEYTWVDATGKPLNASQATAPTQNITSASSADAGTRVKPYKQEVVDLWRRVNPGVMENYVAMPQSTMTDHFKWLPAEQEPLDMSRHLKKTDFSEYNEVAARSMKGLITNKGSA